MCMDTLSNRLSSMDTLLLRVEHVTTLVLVLQDMLEPGMCEHIYAPMSTIKQSLEVVMSGQVETLRVSCISVEWQLGNTPLTLTLN